MQRPVAIKEILVPLAGAQQERDAIRARVLREARALARLHSPAIVTVFDVVEDAARHWIIMELVDAESLGDVIRQDGPQPPELVAALGLALAEALGAAHSAGVLHRDVKPGNVLLGRDGRVRLTDFGIAATEGDATLTGTGALVGSPAYIAPERVRGASGTSASDLWGLAATLYAAVEGHPPFEGPETYAVLTAVVEGRRRGFELAGPLESLLTDLLDRGPEERPTLAEVRRRLRAVAGSTPPVPDTVISRPSTLATDEENDARDTDGVDEALTGAGAAGAGAAGALSADAAANAAAEQPAELAGDPAGPGWSSGSANPPAPETLATDATTSAAAGTHLRSTDSSVSDPEGEAPTGLVTAAGFAEAAAGAGAVDLADTARVAPGAGTGALAAAAGAGYADDGLLPLGDDAEVYGSPHNWSGSRRGTEHEQRDDDNPTHRGLLLAAASAAVVIGAAVVLSGVLTGHSRNTPSGPAAAVTPSSRQSYATFSPADPTYGPGQTLVPGQQVLPGQTAGVLPPATGGGLQPIATTPPIGHQPTPSPTTTNQAGSSPSATPSATPTASPTPSVDPTATSTAGAPPGNGG